MTVFWKTYPPGWFVFESDVSSEVSDGGGDGDENDGDGGGDGGGGGGGGGKHHGGGDGGGGDNNNDNQQRDEQRKRDEEQRKREEEQRRREEEQRQIEEQRRRVEENQRRMEEEQKRQLDEQQRQAAQAANELDGDGNGQPDAGATGDPTNDALRQGFQDYSQKNQETFSTDPEQQKSWLLGQAPPIQEAPPIQPLQRNPTDTSAGFSSNDPNELRNWLQQHDQAAQASRDPNRTYESASASNIATSGPAYTSPSGGGLFGTNTHTDFTPSTDSTPSPAPAPATSGLPEGVHPGSRPEIRNGQQVWVEPDGDVKAIGPGGFPVVIASQTRGEGGNPPSPTGDTSQVSSSPLVQSRVPEIAATAAAHATAQAGGSPTDVAQAATYAAHIATDSQTLGQQSAWTRAAFRSTYGDQADAEWLRQHQAELARNQVLYGSAEPRAGTLPTAGAPQGTAAAPNRAIGATRAPLPGETAQYGINYPAAASSAVVPPATAKAPPPGSTTPAATGATVPTQPGAPPPPLTAEQAADLQSRGINPATGEPITPGAPVSAPSALPSRPAPPPVTYPREGYTPNELGTQPVTYPREGYTPSELAPAPITYPQEGYTPNEIANPSTSGPAYTYPREGYTPNELAPPAGYTPEMPHNPVPPATSYPVTPSPTGTPSPAQPPYPAAPAPQPTGTPTPTPEGTPTPPPGLSPELQRALDQAAPGQGQYLDQRYDERGNPIERIPGRPTPVRNIAGYDPVTGRTTEQNYGIQQLASTDTSIQAPPAPPSVPLPAPGEDLTPTPAAPPVSAGDPVLAAIDNPRPLDTLATLAAQTRGPGYDASNDAYNIAQGIAGLLSGKPDPKTGQLPTWAEPYLNDVARLAWAREERQNGRPSDPRNAPVDYVEHWKDAFYGGDDRAPLVKELNQQMIDYGAQRTAPGKPFNWKETYGETGERGLISAQVTDRDCGPNAFSAVLRSRGYNVSPDQTYSYARQNGYHNGNEFQGPQAMVNMANSAGFKAEQAKLDNAGWDRVDSELAAGRPVMLSSPGHWWVVSAKDPNTGKYYAGPTALKGNDPWVAKGGFVYGGAANTAVFTSGDGDPQSRAMTQMKLQPPPTGSGNTRPALSGQTVYQSPAEKATTRVQQGMRTMSLNQTEGPATGVPGEPGQYQGSRNQFDERARSVAPSWVPDSNLEAGQTVRGSEPRDVGARLWNNAYELSNGDAVFADVIGGLVNGEGGFSGQKDARGATGLLQMDPAGGQGLLDRYLRDNNIQMSRDDAAQNVDIITDMYISRLYKSYQRAKAAGITDPEDLTVNTAIYQWDPKNEPGGAHNAGIDGVPRLQQNYREGYRQFKQGIFRGTPQNKWVNR